MNINKYFTVIPVFNEEKNIKRCLIKLKKYTKNIIVVNDGSTDETSKILDSVPKIHIVKLKNNVGKGKAMRLGANYAWKLGAKAVIYMDGDNQHNPKYLPKFHALFDQGCQIVIGTRILRAEVPPIRKLGNILLLTIVRHWFDIKLEDLLCGYRGFTKSAYKKILWDSNDYGVETEVVTLIGRKKLPFQMMVVDTIYLDKYKGFSINGGLKIILKLPYWKFRKL